MKLVLAALASTLVLLAGCATPAAPDGAAPTKVAENKKPVDLGPPPTGSRIPNRTDRLIRVIGGEDAQEDANRVRSLSNTTGARSN